MRSLKGSPGVKITKKVIVMAHQISEELLRLLVLELLEKTRDAEEARQVSEYFLDDVLGERKKSIKTHAACVAWYEKNAVEAVSRNLGTDSDLVKALEKIGQIDDTLMTLGGLCSLSQEGFVAAANVGTEILQAFMEWALKTLPDDGYIMLGVFRHRGLDTTKPAIIRMWLYSLV
ncbi:MAG: hypothetical protein K9M11_01890 [Candidatus Pacebacteria bacterium]|nr:hypothetical protein [Candidatus Paceibacterota bacterium]